MLRQLLSTVIGLILATSATQVQAQGEIGAKRATVDPVAFAVKLLISQQEKYVPDRGPGRLSTPAAVKKWQLTEKKRLSKAYADSGDQASEWPYQGVYRVRGIIPPGYRVGGSAIVCTFLIEAPGFDQDQARQAAVHRSIDFMLKELKTNELLDGGPQRSYDVRGWAHTYALDFFLRATEKKIVKAPKRAAAMRKMIKDLLRRLETNETKGGGWNYVGRGGSSSFMTAPTLLALFRAQAVGFKVKKTLVTKAIAALEEGRVENGAFAYSGKGRKNVTMGSSAARSHIAELALLQAGKSTPEKLVVAVDGFFEYWTYLFKRHNQQGTHVKPYNMAPYYFYYGHRYAALAIEYLPEADRAAMREKLHKLIWKTRNETGEWNDRIFPRTSSFCTAQAGLAFLAPDLPRLDLWHAKKKF